jgi:hypothetical protein
MPTNAELQVLLDKQQIHEVLLRYGMGLDRLDEDLVASVYHTDGIDDHGGSPKSGHEFARWVVEFLGQGFQSTSHVMANPLIAVQDDVAHSQSYYFAWQRFARDGRDFDLVISGRYIDRFERRGGVWKIAHRYRVSDWSRIDQVLEKRQPAERYPRGQRSHADLLYSAFGVSL